MIQNDDIQVRITITDENGDPVVISSLNALEIYVYEIVKGEKVLKATFQKGNAGLYKIITYDDANGIVDIILNRQLTRNVTSDKIYLETKAQFNATSDFISSKQNIGAPGLEIDLVEKTASKADALK